MTETPLPEPLAAYAAQLLTGTDLDVAEALTVARTGRPASTLPTPGQQTDDPDSVAAALRAGWRGGDLEPAQQVLPDADGAEQ